MSRAFNIVNSIGKINISESKSTVVYSSARSHEMIQLITENMHKYISTSDNKLYFNYTDLNKKIALKFESFEFILTDLNPEVRLTWKLEKGMYADKDLINCLREELKNIHRFRHDTQITPDLVSVTFPISSH